MIKVLVDENLSKYFAEGLDKLQYPLGNSIEITSIEKEFYKGIKDEDWIPDWGRKSGVFISQDVRIYTTKQQSALLSKYNIGAFFLKLPKGYRYWDKTQVIIKHWLEIVKIIENNKTPYVYFISAKRVTKG
ncbi:hypothetical protein ACTJKN_12655 [Pedobacter sp. 22163]|uniref:PIN-like domain-containing protein n=1 Tax=Pedobacter sp. 22163 TaxID=3453883 RepID=UPI0023F503EA|nr:hypothetical protein [Pedobacter kyonggii]